MGRWIIMDPPQQTSIGYESRAESQADENRLGYGDGRKGFVVSSSRRVAQGNSTQKAQ